MDKVKKLLLENRAWARGKNIRDPNYFKNLAKDQKPSFLWIGCSDSRVDPSELVNTQPGEMFVHRNIANLVLSSDLNLQSVIQYAVEALKVDHVIVCGHYNCGGVKAALGPKSLSNVEQWISSVRTTYSANKAEVDSRETDQSKINRLVELNVLKQANELLLNSSILNTWRSGGKYPFIHGWVYDLHNGLLRSIITLTRTDACGLNENRDELAK